MTRRDWTILLASACSTLFVAVCICMRCQRWHDADPAVCILLVMFLILGLALLFVLASGPR